MPRNIFIFYACCAVKKASCAAIAPMAVTVTHLIFSVLGLKQPYTGR